MELTLAHYRNRFCMFRTYYALAEGIVKPEGFDLKVIEVADPPSHELEEVLIRGEVEFANIYLPNFLKRKLGGAPIVGLSTEWKSTSKGNGVFVLKDGPVQTPKDLEGRLIASHHSDPHAMHCFLLRKHYKVDDSTIRWESHPQEELVAILKEGKADAVTLIDQVFWHGEKDPDVRCLYTDGDAWRGLHGLPEIIKHMLATREDLLQEHPEFAGQILDACRKSIAYSDAHLEEVADKFIARYGGEKQDILASAGYPKIEFTFTDTERKEAEATMDMLIETGRLEGRVDLSTAFVS